MENIRLKILALDSSHSSQHNSSYPLTGSLHDVESTTLVDLIYQNDSVNLNDTYVDYEYDIHIPKLVPELPDDIKASLKFIHS